MCTIVHGHGCMIPFRIFLGLVHHSKKGWGLWHINTCLYWPKMSKMAKTKPQNMYNGVRNKLEIMHIRVGHIRNRVYAPSSNLLGLSFPTENNLGGVTREKILKVAKDVKNGQNKAQRYVQLSSK